MNKNPNRAFEAEGKFNRGGYKYRRPFWLPASNYYILTAVAAIIFFFLVLGVFHEESEDFSLVFAGIGAGVILGGAVFLREVILRKARRDLLLAKKRLDENVNRAALKSEAVGGSGGNKLTLERNAAILKEITRKSEAAKVLGKLSDGHYEVFEMCNEYLLVSANELKTVGIGSPRIAAFRRGREKIHELHRFHLLQWAEIETKTLTREANNSITIADKLETSQKALLILESALHHYPEDLHLNDSKEAVNEFIASIKVSHWIEQAEKSAFKGNYKRAVSQYRDALFYLGRENVKNEQRQNIADRINAEIDRIRSLNTPKTSRKPPLKKKLKGEEHYD